MRFDFEHIRQPATQLGNTNWSFSQDLRPFFPTFELNREIGEELENRGVVDASTDSWSEDYSCINVDFTSEEATSAFLVRLNEQPEIQAYVEPKPDSPEMLRKNSMLDAHPAHEKADYISTHVPELAALYQSIGMKSYFDGQYLEFGMTPPEGYDPYKPIAEELERKKQQIDNILWELTYNEIENARSIERLRPNTAVFKDAAVALAQLYVNLAWLHTPWTTSKILTQVLDSELVPLKEEAFGLRVAWSSSNRRKRKLYNQLHLLREEVASGCFDAQELDLRLHKLEEDGLYVQSLCHALLHLRHGL